MTHHSKKAQKEREKIVWPTLSQILKETLAVLVISVLFALFIGGTTWLLQYSFTNLIAKLFSKN